MDKIWDVKIKSSYSFFDFNFKEIIEFKDLLFIMVYRDFKASYKQTVLGPLWFFLQPLVNSFAYYFVFGKVINIDLQGYNPIHFYLTGVIFWNLFSSCTTLTSNVFITSAGIFKKVYFPRLIAPLAIVISALMRFAIQFAFVFILVFFSADSKIELSFISISLLFFSIVSTALLAMSVGLIFANLSRKYRDFNYLISFGLQLLMFITPVLYPMRLLDGSYLKLLELNPLTTLLQAFRYVFFNLEEVNFLLVSYSFFFIAFLAIFSVLLFNKSSRNFVDTI
jgi:lipopolysaccharide transport system permease protein